MSKEFIIPLKYCKDLTTNSLNNNKYDKVDYNEYYLENNTEKQTITTDDFGVTLDAVYDEEKKEYYGTSEIIYNSNNNSTDLIVREIQRKVNQYYEPIEEEEIDPAIGYVLVKDYTFNGKIHLNFNRPMLKLLSLWGILNFDTELFNQKNEHSNITISYLEKERKYKDELFIGDYFVPKNIGAINYRYDKSNVDRITYNVEWNYENVSNTIFTPFGQLDNWNTFLGVGPEYKKSGYLFLLDFGLEATYITINSQEKEYGIGTNEISLSTNEFMQNTTKYNEVPICEHNAQQIINQYKNGKSTIKLEIVCAKFYDSNDDLILDNTKGEIPQVGDIFSIEPTDLKRYSLTKGKRWQITNVNFKYNGVLTIELDGKELI